MWTQGSKVTLQGEEVIDMGEEKKACGTVTDRATKECGTAKEEKKECGS